MPAQKEFKMKLTPMKDDRYLAGLEDWTILNENDAINSTHACLISVPKADIDDKNGRGFLFFSNTPASSFSKEEKERIYALIDTIWPIFAHIRAIENPTPDKDTLAAVSIAMTTRMLEASHGKDVAEFFRKKLEAADPDTLVEFTKNYMNCDDDSYANILSYMFDNNCYRHAFFEIYPEGEYPHNGTPPYGAMIITREGGLMN